MNKHVPQQTAEMALDMIWGAICRLDEIKDECVEAGVELEAGRLTPEQALNRVDRALDVWHRQDEILRDWKTKECTERVEPKPEYRTPQSTIDAFFGWIVRQDTETQARWLAQHPKDEAYLRKLWSEKC